jgi:hypothetical protein
MRGHTQWVAVAVVAGLLLPACGTPVTDVHLSEDASYFLFGATPSPPKDIYSTADEKVTLTVRFRYNVAATYRTFYVRWIGPDGRTFLEEPKQTKWGSNEILIVSLPIAGNLPSTMPGDWSVELWHDDERMLARKFRIEAPAG